MLKRQLEGQIRADLETQAAVALLGPRQVGKTTLAPGSWWRWCKRRRQNPSKRQPSRSVAPMQKRETLALFRAGPVRESARVSAIGSAGEVARDARPRRMIINLALPLFGDDRDTHTAASGPLASRLLRSFLPTAWRPRARPVGAWPPPWRAFRLQPFSIWPARWRQPRYVQEPWVAI